MVQMAIRLFMRPPSPIVLPTTAARRTEIDPNLMQAQVLAHAFESLALCFRVDSQDDEELQHHHRREEPEGCCPVVCSDDREDVRDGGVHDPVRAGPEPL